jgi:hypothetical protein
MTNKMIGLVVIGAVSSAAVAAMAAACAKAEGQSPWKPINAISHIAWGPEAARRTGVSWRYTGLGLLLNLVACGFWAWVYQPGRRSSEEPASLLRSAGRSLVVSAVAYVTDYHVVPSRFTPGFELTLSRRQFPWLYGALAAGLLAPDLIARGRLARRLS